jgi:hypothetical protein
MPTSYKPVVRTGNDPKFYDNALRFATRAEAEKSAYNLSQRWMLVVEWSVEVSEDPVNYKMDLESGEVTSV